MPLDLCAHAIIRCINRGSPYFFMKAFLLAAGHGTRLKPITDKVPKCLVPIRGTPMLAIWLAMCTKIGITDLLINLHAHAEIVRSFLREHNSNEVRVHIAEEQQLLGSAGTLRANRRWVEQEELFWVFYADVLHCANLNMMLHLHRQHNLTATLGVYKVPDPSRCGIVATNSQEVIEDFIEKPNFPTSDLAFSGLMIATPAFLTAIPEHIPADIGFDVLPKLKKQMLAFRIQDYLIDVGTMENYQKAQLTWPGYR